MFKRARPASEQARFNERRDGYRNELPQLMNRSREIRCKSSLLQGSGTAIVCGTWVTIEVLISPAEQFETPGLNYAKLVSTSLFCF